MKSILIFIYFVSFFSFSSVWAQKPDTLKTDEINVVRAFEPKVTLVSKVDFPPNLPKINVSEKHDPQQYTLKDNLVSIPYTPEDLRPLKYSSPDEENTSIGYLKAGFGNNLTPVLKLALANKNFQKYRTGLNVDFIHSKSNKPKFRQYYELGIQGYGEYHLDKMTIGAKVGLEMDQYYLYGRADNMADTLSKDALSRRYVQPTFGLYFFNHATNRWDMNFSGNLDVEIVSTDFQNKGSNVNFGLHGYKEFNGDTYKVGLDIDGQHSSNTNSENSYGRMVISFRPYGSIKKGIWKLEVGPVLMIDDGDVFVLPSIQNSVRLIEDKLVMYNEWNSKIEYDNLVRIHRENPFIARNINFHDYRFQERTIIGLRGTLPMGFSYNTKFGQNVWRDVPLFVNDTNNYRQFVQVEDDKITAWNGHVELEYEKSGQYGAQLGFDYYSYKTTDEVAAWHLPEMKFYLSGNYTWNKKLFVQAELITLAGIKVRNQQMNVEKLSPQVDINLSANYQLNKNIGFFVELNNLLNNQQPRYYLYDRFGFQGIGGVKVVF